MLNNSATTTIDFEVVKGLAPDILHVQARSVPGQTTFTLTHDRPENEVVVTIEVFDLSGRILWTHSEQAISIDNTYTYTWSQSSASGQPIATGTYLYRAIVSSPTGQSASKAQKMLIKR